MPSDVELSRNAIDLILRLICDQQQRMGANGIDDFKKHPFFAGTDWKNLKNYKAPFTPQVIDHIN